MNTLIHQSLQSKTPITSLRSISSLFAHNPLKSTTKDECNDTPFNPFHLFNHQVKTRKLAPKEIKAIHTHTLKTGRLQFDVFVANSLIDWYCKSATLVEARRLFDEIPNPNLVSWNLIISGYTQSLQYEESWGIFCKMRSLHFEPNQSTYGHVISACAACQSINWGKQVYSLVLKNGCSVDGYVRTGMIDLLAKNCYFDEALRVFLDVLDENNVVCWNAIIAGAVRNSGNFVALDLFHLMLSGYSMPNGFTIPSVLNACTGLGELVIGRGVHGMVIKLGLEDDVFVGTSIVDFYAKCGEINEAVKEFLCMPIHNVVSWTTIISGFVQKEDSISALHFFKEMREIGEEINNFTLTCVLSACAKPTMQEAASQLHSWIVKTGFYSDASVKDSLINMYSKIGEVGLAEMVFGEIGRAQNAETWASMISSFAQNQCPGRAIELFRRMLQEGMRPNEFCSSSVLSIIDCIHLGRQLHCYILKFGLLCNVSVGSALFTMYSKCGSLEESFEVFRQIQNKDEVSWNSMIAGFTEHGFADHAFLLFREMLLEKIKPDRMTLSSILTACSSFPCLQKGKEIHGYALRMGVNEDVLVGSTLVSMYSKCRSLHSAQMVFKMMPKKDQVSWSSLISGYVQNGHVEDSLSLFHEMLTSGFSIESFTISSLMGMASSLTESSLGKQLHAPVIKTGLDSYLSVGSSLVTMYSKCGSIDDCHKVFHQIENPDLFTWTSLIIGYAQHGKGTEALRLFELMKGKGIKPDGVTFVGVLSACSHVGLVEEGYSFLNSMSKDYGIEPGSHHFACMVDLLGRSGRLEQAKEFINNMPIEPDALVWGTLLAACKVHGDVEIGSLAAKRVFELEPIDSGAYVSLSNIFADVGRWDEVVNVRSLMKGAGVDKEPGWSYAKRSFGSMKNSHKCLN